QVIHVTLPTHPHHDQAQLLRGPAGAEVVHAPRMLESREDLGRPAEALRPLPAPEDLHRDRRAGLPIAAAVDHAHPSARGHRTDLEPSVEDVTLTHRHLDPTVTRNPGSGGVARDPA